jgi:hypothetical protein
LTHAVAFPLFDIPRHNTLPRLPFCANILGLKPLARPKTLPLHGCYEDKKPFYNKKTPCKHVFIPTSSFSGFDG